ncbi:MAG: hypothetical protein K6F99_04450 [Lachnospiraceae bacterium]|nr:hypothetical protein [Lachnospiraceae bacterium]
MNNIKKLIATVVALIMVFAMSVPVFAEVYTTATPDQWVSQEYTGFKYKNDPMQNADAAKDIVVDPKAVYGYSPRPDSTRLKDYVSYDWSDPIVVWRGRQDRLKYLKKDAGMYSLLAERRLEGRSTEEIAREISALRNEIRLASYDDDPEGLAKVKASNLRTYGNENGPTPESLYKKYGSWDMVLKKAFASNTGMDACLGLYDDNYAKYLMLGDVIPVNPVSK